MEIPDVHYARSGGVAIAYQSAGDGPTVVYAPHLCTIEALWRAPHTRPRSSTGSPSMCG